MIRALTISVGALVLVFAVACGSADEGGSDGAAAAAQVADLSQFPTPTRSQAAPQPEPTQPVAAAAVQTQSGQSEDESESAEVEPMSQEELQQLRQRLQSGELSAEERQEAIQRIQAQFGGGPAGGGFGGGGTQAIGSIEAISGNIISVNTELATISATVGENANIRITSILEPTALTEGAQVTVISERVDGSTLARVITVVPEGQGGLGRGGGGFGGGGAQAGQGGFGGGQAGAAGGPRPLIGTIESIADSGFTLETQQGPLPITTNEETVIIQTSQGTIDDLESGMQVRVAGQADEGGTIQARLVTVTPEGLENIPGIGGGRGAFGGGRGGQRGGGN